MEGHGCLVLLLLLKMIPYQIFLPPLGVPLFFHSQFSVFPPIWPNYLSICLFHALVHHSDFFLFIPHLLAPLHHSPIACLSLFTSAFGSSPLSTWPWPETTAPSVCGATAGLRTPWTTATTPCPAPFTLGKSSRPNQVQTQQPLTLTHTVCRNPTHKFVSVYIQRTSQHR